MMDYVDEKKRKPRRTKGTPSYYYRNKFAAATIAVGCAIFSFWSLTPVYKKFNDKLINVVSTVSEDMESRKFLINLTAAPRTTNSIKQADEDCKQVTFER